MPRVVPDQRSKFENEEFFRKLSRECEVRRGEEVERSRARTPTDRPGPGGRSARVGGRGSRRFVFNRAW
uniref:Uncharacterized protein n=1 Tax=Sphaerodactylus townsendi TaxID=933632 RepID=A0ACB8EA43_9SAUR